MEIEIRNAEENDFPFVIELFREFAVFEKLPERMVNTVERMKQEKDYFECIVAETSSGELVGYAVFFYSYATWSGKSLYMDDLYVKEKYRKLGIGGKLLKKVIHIAMEQNCAKMRWQVSNWNHNAQAFYKSIGAVIDDVELNCDLVLR